MLEKFFTVALITFLIFKVEKAFYSCSFNKIEKKKIQKTHNSISNSPNSPIISNSPNKLSSKVTANHRSSAYKPCTLPLRHFPLYLLPPKLAISIKLSITRTLQKKIPFSIRVLKRAFKVRNLHGRDVIEEDLNARHKL